MIKLRTQEAISQTKNRVVRCHRASLGILESNIYYRLGGGHLSLHYHVHPTLWSFRDKVDDFLNHLLNIEEDKDKEYLLYTARRTKHRVKIKALPKRIRSIRALHKLEVLYSDIMGLGEEKYINSDIKLAIAIIDITFLRCLFSMGMRSMEDNLLLDLSRAALPDDDVKVRVGNYNLLYDSIDKEWTLWMKKKA